jgi:hypothetical protein
MAVMAQPIQAVAVAVAELQVVHLVVHKVVLEL